MARIPRRKLRPLPLGVKAVALSIEKELDDLNLGTVQTEIKMLPASKVISAINFQVSEILKDGVNFFQTGTFGYPGLLGAEMEVRSSRKGRSSILI